MSNEIVFNNCELDSLNQFDILPNGVDLTKKIQPSYLVAAGFLDEDYSSGKNIYIAKCKKSSLWPYTNQLYEGKVPMATFEGKLFSAEEKKRKFLFIGHSGKFSYSLLNCFLTNIFCDSI